MGLFHFTTDKTVRRLSWLMIAVMFFDLLNTLYFQPIYYWQHPERAIEYNRFFRLFLSRGLAVYLPAAFLYATAIFLFVSMAPRRLAIISILSFIFGHYFGACTWLDFYWHFGTTGPVVYGIVLGTALVLMAFPATATQDKRSVTPNLPGP